MEVVVEGDWKNFRIKMIEPQDHPKILEHLKSTFYKDEVMFQLVGYSEELANSMNIFVSHYLNNQKDNNLSFFALDRKTEKVAGVRITHENVKDSIQPELPIESSENLKKIHGFIQPIHKIMNLHEKYNLDSYAKFFMTSVDIEFRHQGLVTELYSRSLQLIEKKGYKLVSSLFSSPYTRRVATKFGFEELSRFYYAQSIDENGSQRFPNAKPDQFLASMVKEF